MKLLVFLGNPGDKYTLTRHNAGFMVGDRLAERLNAPQWAKKNNYLCTRVTSPDCLLVKPQTFMNLSGEVFRWLPDAAREDIMVVADDVALPLGRLRFREKGSCGGHNGLRSIEQALGGQDYPRLRFGVNLGEAPRGEELVGFVLGAFPPAARALLQETVDNAASACGDWLRHGLPYCQDKYNSGK